MASSQSTNGGFTRLVRTLLLGRLGPRKSLQQILENSTPGLTFLHQFFKNWLKLDLTSIAAALTIFGTISGALGDIKILGLKLYWWIVKLFTASISIASNDRLNREVLNWLGSEVLDRQQARILTATSERVQNDAFYYRRSQPVERHYEVEKRVPIQYLPTFGMTWFIHERNVFMVKRIATNRDAVASQEGRIVFMTTNVADKLAQALVRPGRIDRKIFLGSISQRSAEVMFLRMFMPDPKNSVVLDEGFGMEELQKFALEFSGKIPNDIFTPAQLQGYLHNHRNTPAVATREVESWVHDEQVRTMIRKEEARKAKERRNQKKRASLKLLSRGLELEYESEVKNGREMARRPRTRRGKDTGSKAMEHETSLDDVLDAMEPNNYNSMEETDEGYIYNSVERKARTVQNYKCEELKDHNPTVANLVSRERRKEAALGIASKEATGCNNEEKTSRGTIEETQ